MVRCDWCKIRENIEILKRLCEKDDDTWKEMETVADFVKEYPAIAELTGGAMRPLIRERNNQIKQKAILSLSKALECKKHPITGEFCNKLTGGDVSGTISKIKIEAGLEAVPARMEFLDTGIRYTCPICKKTFGLIHIEPLGLHKLIDQNDLENKDKIITKLITDDIDETFDYLADTLGGNRSTLLREVFLNLDKENKILQYASEKLGIPIDEILEDIKKEKGKKGL